MSTVEQDARLSRLDARLHQYHGQGISAILEAVGHLREPGDTVILGGSLAVGLGNRFSDIDVVIVGATSMSSIVPLQHWAGSMRLDLWLRTTADIDDLFALAREALASPTPILRTFGTVDEEQELKLLHRVAFGARVDGALLKPGTVEDHVAVARDLLAREYAERLRESACLARLAVAAGRELMAATTARAAVQEAMHAVLHGAGVPFTGDKWLAEQVRAFPDLATTYRAFASLPDPGPATSGYVEQAIACAAALTGLDLGGAALAQGLRWRLAGLTLLPLEGTHLLVSKALGGAWEVDADQARAWDVLTASADGELVAHPPDPSAAALCAHLYEQGLAAPVWEHGLPVDTLSMRDPEVRP